MSIQIPEPPQTRRNLKRYLLLPLLGALVVAGCGESTIKTTADTPTAGAEATPAATQKKQTTTHATEKPAEKKKPEMTSGQKNALESAQNYLDMSGFSKAGLIQQLSSSAGDDFSKADATFAANHAGADWRKEAVESAQSYLDMTSFSKAGLVEQLSSSAGSKFTPAQARYAASKVY
jgi:hypothetical protein